MLNGKTLTLVVPLLVAGAAFCFRGWMHMRGPSLSATEFLELGRRENGHNVVVTVPIRNDGAAPLHLYAFRPSCGTCLSVLHRQEVVVPPASSLSLQFQLAIVGKPGESLVRSVTFSTNDSRRPKWRLEMRFTVQGGVTAVPDRISLGAKPVGHEELVSIDIRDTSVEHFVQIQRVESSDSEAFEIVSVENYGRPAEPKVERLGQLATRIGVRVRLTKPGTINGEIRVFDHSGSELPRLTIPVHARAEPPIVVHPSSVVFPMKSQDGDQFSMRCLCRSSDGRPFAVSVLEAPAGLSILGHESRSSASIHVLEIHCDSVVQSTWSRFSSQQIKLKATFADGVQEFDIVVRNRGAQ